MIYTLNHISRIFFLLLTPAFFQFLALGFLWHSIYWGVTTLVLLLWICLLLVTPVFGRIGCGWFCFMGTLNDLAGQVSVIKNKWKKPLLWLRIIVSAGFFSSAFTFFAVNLNKGITHNFAFIPFFLKPEFSMHYKIFWVMDFSLGLLSGLLLEKRWLCKNACFMGFLFSLASKISILLPVIDPNKCTGCGMCESSCPVGIPLIGYIENENGLLTNTECIRCGKCIKVCRQDAIRFKFIINRNKFKEV